MMFKQGKFRVRIMKAKLRRLRQDDRRRRNVKKETMKIDGEIED